MKITNGFRFIHKPKKIAEVVIEKTQDVTETVMEHVGNLVVPVAETVTEKITETTSVSIERLENTKRFGIFVSTAKRFFRVNGIDLFGVTGNEAKIMHNAFPSATDLKSYYTFFGLLSFLIWGIPLAIQVGRIFAITYDSRRFTLGKEITRGVIWFVLFLGVLTVSRVIPTDGPLLQQGLSYLIRFGSVFVFWVFTPALLVRDGAVGIKFLLVVGAVSAFIDGIILPIIYKFTIPFLLQGWDRFGSIGVSMTIATWCVITTTAWVIIACFGGELAHKESMRETITQVEDV